MPGAFTVPFMVLCSTRKYLYSPPQKGLEFPGGGLGGGSLRPKNLKKCSKFNWNFQRGEGSWKKSLPWGRYGYFMELHIEPKGVNVSY